MHCPDCHDVARLMHFIGVQLFVYNSWLTWILLFCLSVAARLDEYGVHTTTLYNYRAMILLVTILTGMSTGACVLELYMRPTHAAEAASVQSRAKPAPDKRNLIGIKDTPLESKRKRVVGVSMTAYAFLAFAHSVGMLISILWLYNWADNTSGMRAYIDAGFDSVNATPFVMAAKMRILESTHVAAMTATGFLALEWAVRWSMHEKDDAKH